MRRAGWKIVLLFHAACAQEPASETPRALVTASPASPPPSSAPASATPRVASSAESEQERPRPPRTGIAGSTKGTIACGSKRCSAPAEGCVWVEAAFDWSCLAPDAPLPEGPDVGTAFLACDDGTDCPQGQTCCNPWGEHFSGTTKCVARADVDATCASELCMHRSAGGAHCPSGRTCEGASATDAGVCEAPVGPATCGGRRACPASAPICVDGPKGLQCVAKSSPEWKAVRGDHRYECTLQSDCHAGDTCAYQFGEIEHEQRTYCGKWHPAYQGSLVCEVGKLDPCRGDAECRTKMTCHPSKQGPPWMGVWGSK
jgi:hypothetical protein